ncbi:uncharacterized protein KD926_002089 [Aspergillus affinis]|uniref:uncharacterized protein n=1 Tax=Aspergillus affinis TaxID=1070780 RepID=UPI0022FE7E31|nr:uncharacterized protein KD926_002089 [Aspergillus affinis]KAI9036325.1 hypothetical protein KD926_002089 [Aspergillus affinis]
MSRFATAVSTGQALNVPMNKAGFVSFINDGKKAIGTGNLNGCTAIMIVSKRGAILAHISPLPYPTTDAQAAKNHTREQMGKLLDILRNEKDFRLAPDVKTSGIVCGVFEGTIALPDQKNLIEDILLENLEDNPMPRVLKYNIQEPAARSPAAGTVFIDGSGPEPKVYLEDVDQGWF